MSTVKANLAPLPGSTAAGHVPSHEDHRVGRLDVARIFFVLAAVVLTRLAIPHAHIIAITATLIGGYPIFEEAISNLRERRMTMELSMSIALCAALTISEAFTALVITLFVLVAEVLEKLTMSRGRKAIHSLLALMPQDVFIREGDAVEECDLARVRLGDVVVVKPGARVPVDGIVVAGHSHVDQSAITGESMPSEKLPGSTVFAGTINQSGTVDVKTTSIGEDTAFGKIIHAVESAETYQAPIQKTADRLAGYLVYFAIGCALITFFATHNVRSTIAVVIVAGACGIAAGTPLAILGGIGRAARSGAIVKGGVFLERLSDIDTVVFDKTGTLTLGEPAVTAIETFGDASTAQVLQVAATAELTSEHPLGKAIVRRAKDESVEISAPDTFSYIPGKGIICSSNNCEIVAGNRVLMQEKKYSPIPTQSGEFETSQVFVGKDQVLLGVIKLADVLRPEARDVVSALREMGITSILLTGDAKPVAQAIARKVGITEIAAEVLPVEKQTYIKSLSQSRRTVAMVGDGINDAPALIQASVGIAVGSGTDVARECANIVLIGSDLSRLVAAVQIARRCKRIIMANFVGTLVVDGIGVALAAIGCLNPLLAAFIHVSSELVFIMNSARLLPPSRAAIELRGC
jgi:Cd2+/Zn2+-exporting ATPase/Cu+-exporting ATPase